MPREQTIAIIEDEETLAQVLKGELEDEGFRAVVARDGISGLALIRAERPNLVLLDIILPKMDGMTMLEKMRQEPATKSIPVILLTNLNADDDTTRKVMKNEPAYYLVKSGWKPSEVIEKVKERLN
jgi:DNA-binding response OmpR family regulator